MHLSIPCPQVSIPSVVASWWTFSAYLPWRHCDHVVARRVVDVLPELARGDHGRAVGDLLYEAKAVCSGDTGDGDL